MRVDFVFEDVGVSLNTDFSIDMEMTVAATAAAIRAENAAADAEAAAERAEGQILYAEQLRSDIYAEDSTPYLYRASYSGDREYDTLVGGSVGWNQLIPATANTATQKGVTYTNNNDGTWTLTGTPTTNNSFLNLNYVVGETPFTASHVYFVKTWTSGTNTSALSSIGFRLYYVSETSVSVFASESLQKAPSTISETGHVRLQVSNLSGTNIGTVQMTPQLIDLTLLLGSSLADYLYTLESGSAGAGVALLKKWGFCTKDYYPYDAGSLLSVQTSAHQMRDADDNIIATYPLDSSLTLRGVPKKDANNNFYYDGDIYKSDGTVTRKYGIVDLGTLTWSFVSAAEWNCFMASVSGRQKGNNLISAKYPCVTLYNVSTVDKAIQGNANNSNIYIRDTSYSTAAAFKTAMSGVYLVYELATPTTETADPYQELQIVDEYGTEEYIDSRTVPVPVGHNTRYPTNQVAKLDGLPSDFSTLIAPTEKTYTATRNYTTGSLFIVNNILYKATANIANGGTITPNTNCTATTLAAVIAAL